MTKRAASPPRANFGDLARDLVTGFTGVVTGHTRHITGLDQVCLTPKVNVDGTMRSSAWFEVPRIEVVKPAEVDIAGQIDPATVLSRRRARKTP